MCAFLHAHEAEGFPRFGLLWVKTLAVVVNGENQFVSFHFQTRFHAGSLRVACNVGQGFLKDAENSYRAFGIQIQRFPRQRHPAVNPGAPLERSEEHTSELQSLTNLVCRLLLEKKKKK